MTVSENLKLRTGEATTTTVLTVMQAGTKVKILELGKAEKIDGINSNWVKVEIQSGAKDRDGKEIKSGTIGWCYGYNLENTTLNQFKYLLNTQTTIIIGDFNYDNINEFLELSITDTGIQFLFLNYLMKNLMILLEIITV